MRCLCLTTTRAGAPSAAAAARRPWPHRRRLRRRCAEFGQGRRSSKVTAFTDSAYHLYEHGKLVRHLLAAQQRREPRVRFVAFSVQNAAALATTAPAATDATPSVA